MLTNLIVLCDQSSVAVYCLAFVSPVALLHVKERSKLSDSFFHISFLLAASIEIEKFAARANAAGVEFRC